MAVFRRSIESPFSPTASAAWCSGYDHSRRAHRAPEGLSLSLFIPLLQSQIGTENAGIIGSMTALF